MTAFLLKWSAAVAVVLGLMVLGADWETGHAYPVNTHRN